MNEPNALAAELRRIADANGAPEMDPMRRAADMLEVTRKTSLEEAAKVASKLEWYRTFPMDNAKPLESVTYRGDVAASIRQRIALCS